jgi:chitinase
MSPVDSTTLTVSYDGTCGPEKRTKCSSGCCSQYGNCGTSPEHCSGACQHAFGTGCVDPDVAGSWQLASKNGLTDEAAGGQYYFDAANRLFWTWDTPELMSKKFDQIVRKYKLGGVMAWSLGEDSFDWSHVRQMTREVAKDGYGQAASAASVDVPSTGETSEEMHSPVSSPSPVVQPPPRSSSAVPYNIVWVNGTQQGPEGDYAETPASPSDYTVSYPAEDTTSEEAPAAVAPVNPSTVPEVPVTMPETEPEVWQPALPAPVKPTFEEPTSIPEVVSAQPNPQPSIAIPCSPNTIDIATPEPVLSKSQTTSEDWAIDDTFSPDPGYVNPNWPPQGATPEPATPFPPPTEELPWSSQPMQPAEEAPAAVSVAAASPSAVEAQKAAHTRSGSCRVRRRKKAGKA